MKFLCIVFLGTDISKMKYLQYGLDTIRTEFRFVSTGEKGWRFKKCKTYNINETLCSSIGHNKQYILTQLNMNNDVYIKYFTLYLINYLPKYLRISKCKNNYNLNVLFYVFFSSKILFSWDSGNLCHGGQGSGTTCGTDRALNAAMVANNISTICIWC